MSKSNLEVSKANRVNEMSERNDLTAESSYLERSAKHVTKFRLDEINKIKDYLNSEIKERKDIIKKISKYIVAFNYADKLFITLSASFGTLSVASDATIICRNWNICRNSWSIFNFNIYRNDWCS